MLYMEILLLLSGLFISWILLPQFCRLLSEGNLNKENYRGDSIPVGLGVVMLPVVIASLGLQRLMGILITQTQLFFIFALSVICLVGLLDDVLGSRSTLGFKGHLTALFRGQLTTGGLKLLAGGMIAFIISSHISSAWFSFGVNFFLIAFMTNLLNLLDLRPGRALKFFLITGIPFIFTIKERSLLFSVIPLFSFSAIYLPMDLKAKAMLGDAGSNVLGMGLGLICAYTLSPFIKGILVILLLGIHLIAERYSLTAIIEKNGFLNYLDQWGRNHHAKL